MGVSPAGAALVCGACVVLGAARPARADVDWGTGLVTARALGVADRHAPSPASAREPARRVAEDAARVKLAAEVATLPLAGGGTVAKAQQDAAVKARLERAIAAAIRVDWTLHTDGSAHVTLAVPIEAVRQAIAGPRAVAPAGDTDPAVVVVEGVALRPALGVTVGGQAVASLWPKAVPAWAKDAPRVRAKRSAAGAVELAAPAGGPATLFVLVP